MLDEKVSFANAPNIVRWSRGDILIPSVLNYALQRSEILNRIRQIKCNKNSYGVFKLKIDNNLLSANILKVNELECILSDGYEYIYKYHEDNALKLNLLEVAKTFSKEAFVYLAIPNGSINSFNYDMKDSKYKQGNIVSITYEKDKKKDFITLEENSFLHVSHYAPTNCSHVIIAKLVKNNGVIELDNYVPPLLNIKCDQKIIQIALRTVALLRKKLSIVRDDIEVFKKDNNIVSYIECINKCNCLKSSLGMIEPLIDSDGITLMHFYLELHRVLSNVMTLEQSSDFPTPIPYQHDNILNVYQLMWTKIQNTLEQEISDSYRLIKFEKKENYFSLNIPSNASYKEIKVAVRRSKKVKDTETIEWMKSSLICEQREFLFHKEKRSLGFEREIEISNIESHIKQKYLIFNIYPIFKKYNDNNELIMYQTNALFHKIEPEEISFYQEKEQ